MVYLALQVLFWMLAAFVLGLITGWWMKKVLWIAPSVSTRGQKLDCGHDVQLADMQDRLREKQQTIAALQAQLKKAPVVTNSQKENKPTTQKTKDDLKKIYGIGKVIEAKLNRLGITRFEHVAKLSGDQVKKVSNELDAFKDRIKRDNWVASAKQCYYEKYGKHI